MVKDTVVTGNVGIGSSSMASALGARISVVMPERGMYLVVGRGMSPASLVSSMEGEILLELSDYKVLATLPFVNYLTLRSNRDIAMIGPVSVDKSRLAKIIDLLKQGARPKPGITVG